MSDTKKGGTPAPSAKDSAAQLSALTEAASLKSMVMAAKPSIDKLAVAYGQLLDALDELVMVAEDQGAAAKAAQEHAIAHGLETSARALGRNPLIAHTIQRLGIVRLPPISEKRDDGTEVYVNVQAWLKQFAGSTALEHRAFWIQRILNSGEILPIPGATAEQVADALLHGRDPQKLEKKPVVNPTAANPRLDESNADGWFGFRGGDKPAAPLTDANIG